MVKQINKILRDKKQIKNNKKSIYLAIVMNKKKTDD